MRTTTLVLLLVAIGLTPSLSFGQTSPIKGKNVTIYLEDAEFGVLAERFVYDPNARLVDIQDEPEVRPTKGISPISTAHFVDTGKKGMQSKTPQPLLKKVVPQQLGTGSIPKPLLHGKPQTVSNQTQAATETISFEMLSTIPLTKRKPTQYSHVTDSKILQVSGTNPIETVTMQEINPAQSTSMTPTLPESNPYHPLQSVPENFVRSKAQPASSVAMPEFPVYSSHQVGTIAYAFEENPSRIVQASTPASAPLPDMTSHPIPTPLSAPIPLPIQPLPQKEAGSKLAWTKGKFTITPYGYVNLSAAWESERTVAGDYCVYAQSPELNPASDRSAFYVDPRSSRIGAKIDGPGFDCWTDSFSRGAFEVDFQGAYQSRNRSGFLLRKAFVEVGDKRTKFLFGQDWEVVAPLYPSIFNYPAGSGSGNLGYRRAMIKMDHIVPLDCDSSWLFQFAICDNTIRDYLGAGAADPRITASGWPILQGRFAWSFGEKTFAHRLPVTIGVSGQIGEQKGDFGLNTPNPEYNVSLPTWVVCFDFDIPVTKKLRLQAELYDGENHSNLEGGILQGVDFYRRDTIRSRGGWGAIMYQWTKKMKTNVGYAIEDPYNKDILATSAAGTARTYNHSIFGNVMYNWTEAFMTGLELSQWKTNWQHYDPLNGDITYKKPGEPFRIEFVTRYTF